MELQKVSPFDLKPNPWNSNRVNRENFEKLKKSLQSLGSFKPIIVREVEGSFQILGGYHRNEAAKELGFPTVPVINIGNIDDDRAKEISLVDNTRYGEDDTEALAKLLDSFETDLLAEIMPEAPIELPDTEDALSRLDEEMKKVREEEDSHRVLKYRLSNEEADEVEAVLSSIAAKFGYKYPDGYSNFSQALHHLALRYGD